MRRPFLAAAALLVLVALVVVWWRAQPEPAPPDRGNAPAERTMRRPRSAPPPAGMAVDAAPSWPPYAEATELTGRVVDAIEHVAVAEATVTAWSVAGEPLDETATDDEGLFTLHTDETVSEVTASAPGFALARQRAPRASGIVLALNPSVRISGRVVDEHGSPVAAAQVWVADSDRGDAVESGLSETDAQGAFEVPDAPMGKLVAYAKHPAYVQGQTAVGSLGPGRERDGVEIVVADTGALRGRVLDARGTPAADAVDLDMSDLISRIRGPTGTTVSLLIERPGNAQPFLVDVVRAQIRT